MLESILSHQGLQLNVLVVQLACLKVVNVRALHAQSDENLILLIIPPPTGLCKGYTHIISPVLLSNCLEIDFLDNLQPILLLAFLAFRSQFFLYDVCHHEL